MARKTKYTDDFPLLAEGYAREGLIDEQISVKLGISIQTFYTYQNKYPEFFEAIKKGKAPIDFEVESIALDRIRGITRIITEEKLTKEGEIVQLKREIYIPPSETLIKFWLVSRKPQKWNSEIEDTSGKKVIVEGGIIKVVNTK